MSLSPGVSGRAVDLPPLVALPRRGSVRGVRVTAASPSSDEDNVTRRAPDHKNEGASLSRRHWLVGIGAIPAVLGQSGVKAHENVIGDLAASEEGETIYINLSEDPILSDYEIKVLRNNLKIQGQNQVPRDFPSFVRDGFNIKVLAEGYKLDESGLIYKDYAVGTGERPVDGQQVTFDYTGYNESGARIDNTYSRGYPAETQLGVGGLIPGFEVGLKGMQVGGRRRIIIPPELGPPVGPSTFFSAKQCEVFDVELLRVKSCRREGFAMFSGLVCE